MSVYITESLGNALFELMKTKPIEKISIDELTKLACIGRASYFRNFNSKEDIITAYIILKWRNFEKSKGLKQYAIYEEYRILSYFQFCLSLKDINSIIISSKCENAILNAYEIIMQDEDLAPNQTHSYKNTYIAYGLYGIFIHWAKLGYHESPEEMTQLIQHFLGF